MRGKCDLAEVLSRGSGITQLPGDCHCRNDILGAPLLGLRSASVFGVVLVRPYGFDRPSSSSARSTIRRSTALDLEVFPGTTSPASTMTVLRHATLAVSAPSEFDRVLPAVHPRTPKGARAKRLLS
jgi:hypothetical protein